MKRSLLFLIPALLIARALVADQVVVPVTVTDSLGRLVTGLDPGAFRLYEDKVEQKVSLQDHNIPLSVGIVLDTSGSMAGKPGDFRGGLSEFLPIALAGPNDEAFLIAFSDRPALVQGFTHDKAAIENGLAGLEPKGKTAFYDAVYLGLTEMEHAKNVRKALVVISDGFNHGGVYSNADVAAFAKRSGVEIYGVGFSDGNPAGIETLRQLGELTGGQTFEPVASGPLRDIFAKIGLNLRDQYLLSYTPTNPARDGGFRKITVKIDSSAGVESPRAFSKSGYYAPVR